MVTNPKSYALLHIYLFASVLICQVTHLLIPIEHLPHARCLTAHFTYHLIGNHSSMRSQLQLTRFYS